MSLVGFVVVGGLVAAWFGLDEVLARIKMVPLPVLLAMLALASVNYFLRVVRWQMFGRHLGVRVPFARNALYYVAGFSMATTPGKLGEVLRLWLIERGHGYRFDRTGAMFVGDRVADLVGVLVWCVVGALLFAGYGLPVLLFALVMAVGIGLLLRPTLLLRLLDGVYARVRRSERLFVRARRALRATSDLFDSPTALSALALSALAWFIEALALHVVLLAMGHDIGVLQSAFVFAFAMLVGVVVMVPGGLGGTEASMSGLLIALGVPADAAIAATLLVRVATLWYAVLVGTIVLPFALRAVRGGGAPPPEARLSPAA